MKRTLRWTVRLLHLCDTWYCMFVCTVRRIVCEYETVNMGEKFLDSGLRFSALIDSISDLGMIPQMIIHTHSFLLL